ncbi:MAG: HEAT repeat domain-containing protein [Ktedonobacterales bacterium]
MESSDPTRPEPLMPEIPPPDLLARLHQRLVARQPYVEHVEPAVAGLDDPRWEIRAAAVHALGERTSPSATIIAQVRKMAQDEHPLVRAAAVRTLGKHGALADVALAFHDSDWAVREMVVITLAASGVSTSHPVLAAAQHDASSRVREASEAVAPTLHPDDGSRWAKRGMVSVVHMGHVLLAQLKLIHPGVWWVPGGIMAVTAGFAAFAAAHTPGFAHSAGLLVALVTLLCATVSIAFLADARHDPAQEILLACRTSRGAVVVCRGVLATGYVALLGIGCSTVVALAGGGAPGMLISLWAQPLLALVVASLALAVMAGSAVALVGSLLLIGAQTCRVSLAHGVSIALSAHFWQFSPLSIAVSMFLLAFAIVYASRDSRLPAVTL